MNIQLNVLLFSMCVYLSSSRYLGLAAICDCVIAWIIYWLFFVSCNQTIQLTTTYNALSLND